MLLEVTNATSITAAVEHITQAVGEAGLVGLVNNAGMTAAGPLEYLPLGDLRRQFEINVVGPLALIPQASHYVHATHTQAVTSIIE